jgi:pilus assembly protein CpaB
MNAARTVVPANALSAGGVAAYPARGSDEKPAAAEPVAQLPIAEILVGKSDIGLGESVKPADLQLQTWPASISSNSINGKASTPSLRSITDVNLVVGGSDDQAPKRGSSNNVARYGIASQSTAQK